MQRFVSKRWVIIMGRSDILLIGHPTRRPSVMINQALSTSSNFDPPLEYFASAKSKIYYLKQIDEDADPEKISAVVNALAECSVLIGIKEMPLGYQCPIRRTSIISTGSPNKRLFSTSSKFDPPLEYFENEELRSDYLKFDRSQRHNRLSAVVNAIADCSVLPLPGASGVTAINLNTNLGFEGYAENVIYARRFYPDLLAAVRSNERCILTSNPGVSKSVFQYYYLARLLNPAAFGPLPPDCFGSTDIPNVVVIQTGSDLMRVIFIKERVVHVCTQVNLQVLSGFNPRTSLYFFEPGSNKNVPPFFEKLELPILATVSPLKDRINEFSKNGGEEVYMPLYEEEELVCIAEHMRSVDARCDITEEQVRKRYRQLGGVIRHVLGSQKTVNKALRMQAKAAGAINLAALTAEDVMENNEASHMLVRYIVPSSGQQAFTCRNIDFLTPSVLELVQKNLDAHSIQAMVRLLIQNDETGFMPDSAPKIFEKLIVLLLATRATETWRLRRQCNGQTAPMFPNQMIAEELGEVPTFTQMSEDKAYYSSNSSFPFADIVFRAGEKLYCVQVTRSNQARELDEGPLNKFMKRMGLSDCADIVYILCPRPSFAEEAKVVSKTELPPENIYILQMPSKYR